MDEHHDPRVARVSALVLVVGLAALCSAVAFGDGGVGAGDGAAPTPVTASPGPASAAPPRLSALQAEGVATVMTFLRAYNAGRLDEALAAFTDDPTYGDCDYATARPRVVGGRAELAALLRDRFADHDRVEVDHLTLNGPVIGVSFARRSSDTLSGIGRTGGVEEVPAAKVILDVFDPGARRNQGTAVRISAFNWAPVGGDPAPCDPGRG